MANFVLQRNADSSIGDMFGTYAPAGAANDPKNTNRLYPGMVQARGSTSATASARCRQQNSSACSTR